MRMTKSERSIDLGSVSDGLTVEVMKIDGHVDYETRKPFVKIEVMMAYDRFSELLIRCIHDAFYRNMIADEPSGDDRLKKSIDDIELSVRAWNGLKNADCITVADVVAKSKGELLKTKNLGRLSLKEIEEALNQMGLRLKGSAA